MPLGLTLNNPGNIRANPGVTYRGEIANPHTGTAAGFKNFLSLAYGYRALSSLLYAYINHHGLDSINKIIHTYAPASDGNNPNSYANTVSRVSGINADQGLSTNDFLADNPANANMFKIILAMVAIEQGEQPDGQTALAGYKMFLDDQGLS
jgi:hypothetical protein